MAVSQIYTAIANDTITAARWNNEFGNIYNNGTDIAFPATKATSFAGFNAAFDAAGLTIISSPGTQGFVLTPGVKSGTPNVTAAKSFDLASQTFTDNATAGSGTATSIAFTAFQRPTLAATNTLVTTTDAATVYVANSPLAGTNQTITNPWTIWIDDGNVRLDGNLVLAGGFLTGDTADSGQARNYRLAVSLSGNAVTVTLQNRAGATPSTYAPVSIAFRNATLATASTVVVNAVAATTIVASAGSTLGTVSATASRIWVGALNNAGTVELFLWNALSTALSIRGLSEAQLITTTAEGGAGDADTAQVPYSTPARTDVAFRWLGYFESTQTTAGTWAQAVTQIQEMQPGVPRIGEVIQDLYVLDAAVATGTVTTPSDNTPPTITEGDQYMSLAVISHSLANALDIHVFAHAANTSAAGTQLTCALHNGGDALAAAYMGNVDVVSEQVPAANLYFRRRSSSVASTTYTVRIGSDTAGTTSFNGEAGTVSLTVEPSTIRIKEIMA